MSKPHFPFTAVCGQAQFKLALILTAINPAIGGVVISGPRGSAKSTLARGMADLLPDHLQAEGDDLVAAEFVTLPLGASEEMLLGTLDLEQVLNDKKMQFSPGLLSKAHGGVLYVDEVNLLPDNLVDLLLDVSTSGVNRVERDGISHSHRSEFLLVGTMNPDEGELRPQLHDRFGFSVNLSNQYAPLERVEIVKRREQFDRNPEAFIAEYADQQTELVDQILAAREKLQTVTCSDELRLDIAERCAQAQVDGLRADIVWYRAALTHAALNQQAEVTLQNIDAVEELVLAHRRKVLPEQNPPQQPPTPPKQDQQGFKRPDDSHRPQSGEGEWGAMKPQQQKTAEKTALELPDLMTHNHEKQGIKQTSELSSRPDWFKTLMSSLPNWPPKALQFKKQGKSADRLHLVLLDTSASTLQAQGFAYAKAAVLQISENAYLNREQIALFGFGNTEVKNLLSRIRAPKELRSWLDQLGAGGGTPMREAFVEARTYLQQLRKQQPELDVAIYVLSDGRSSSSLNGIDLGGDLIWIDTELSQVKRGKGRRFANELNATYLSLSGA
ncbi:ATP-binding protein [Neptuniibacter sp. QD48_11]|uniref:ATP-binding protein n=1 Tax=unclassified Neptuniibacter TaxID=2630693 RepID=UPI0039F55CF8